jgi:two-component system sensor histidine kinase BaeS
MRKLLGSLTARAVAITCLVALVSVVITALIAVPFAVQAANNATRAGLRDKAAIAVDAVDLRPRAAGKEQFVKLMRRQNIDVFLISNGQADRAGLPARVVSAMGDGQPVSGTGAVNGRLMLIEGRTLPGTGNGVVLTEPAVTGTGWSVLRRLWLALLAGLIGGVLAGALLARPLVRPIRHAAAAARLLSAGDRGVRVRPEPPGEVEELAHALNNLAAALATSEGRQREFLLSISHELRTPLTTIRGYAEALSDGVIGPDGGVRAGATMLAEAEHLDRLVSDLLALARLDAADFPLSVLPVDLTALVGDAAEAWGGRAATAGVVLRADIPEEPVVVPTDPGRIRQVLDGLLENALRVVPPGAPVVLAVYPVGPTGYATVEVRDGGPGFTDSDLAVAFERGALYERYRGMRKVGSGLGLALAGGLVRRLGGTIAAGHAPEGGACFTVRLPVYQART